MHKHQLLIPLLSSKCQARQFEAFLLNNPVNLANSKLGTDKHLQETINLQVLTGNPLLERIKYFAQRKKGHAERIFWLIAFVLSMASAVILIYRIWSEQSLHPVIVTFQSEEQDIDSIPFPAVTICNMNLFPKERVLQLLEGLASDSFDFIHDWYATELTLIKSLCNSHESFAKHFKYAYNRGRHGNVSDQAHDGIQDLMKNFLSQRAQPCEEFIKLCKLGDQTVECSKLFKPVFTDHGLCCTFNILPIPLLLRGDPDDGHLFNGHGRWLEGEIQNWTKWNYDMGYVLNDPDQVFPWKQKRAGLPFGLSVLVDPDPEDYYCPTSDSKGVRYILHSPLEQPHVMELASVAGLSKEVLVEVHPDMTTADRNIEYVDHSKRNCFFGWEKQLLFYKPYTPGNCIEECVATVIGNKCQCTYFHLPGFDNLTLCSNDPNSDEFKCIQRERFELQKTMKLTCQDCRPLCQDIAYNYETTTAELQDKSELWLDPAPELGNAPDWAEDDVSIIHFFFGSESTIPKVRKLRQSQTDLIAATGGILGLCIGFSVLSFVEIGYFIVFRTMLKYMKRGWRKLKRKIKTGSGHRTISVNPSKIHVYPSYKQFGEMYY